MPNSFRKRIKKLAFLGYISGEETKEIIQALNKQRPMEVKNGEPCPLCSYHADRRFINYCPYCGQAIKDSYWSE